MKGEMPDCADVGRIRKAVHCQNQNRQIDKKQYQDQINPLPYFFHQSSAPPRLVDSSPPSVSSVNRQMIPRRISAIIDPPFQLYAEK